MRDKGYTGLAARGTLGIGSALLVAAAGCSGGAPPVVAPSIEVPAVRARTRDDSAHEPRLVRFGHVSPAAGARWHVTTEATSSVTDARHATLGHVYLSSYSVEVLDTNGRAPSRVRLSFEQNHYVVNGAETPTSLEGKTYVLETTAPHVRDASGAPAPADEAERVLDIFPELGTRTQIDQVLPDAPMSIGDDRGELAAAVLSVIHPRGWTLGGGSATLTAVDDTAAYFTTTIDATAKNSGIRMWIKGEVRVRLADAQLMGLLLSGTYALPGESESSEPEGVITIRRTTRDL